jgi:iron complex transport system ATP-binding protein
MNLQAFAATPVLELRDVTFRREGDEIIRGVSFTVRAGEHWAMLGPNGAGKSTLLAFCGAVTHPTSGTVHVLGSSSAGWSCRRCGGRSGT